MIRQRHSIPDMPHHDTGGLNRLHRDGCEWTDD